MSDNAADWDRMSEPVKGNRNPTLAGPGVQEDLEVLAGAGVAGIEAQDRAEGGGRLVALAALRQGDPEVDPRAGVPRVQPQRLAELADGVVDPAGALQHEAQ